MGDVPIVGTVNSMYMMGFIAICLLFCLLLCLCFGGFYWHTRKQNKKFQDTLNKISNNYTDGATAIPSSSPAMSAISISDIPVNLQAIDMQMVPKVIPIHDDNASSLPKTAGFIGGIGIGHLSFESTNDMYRNSVIVDDEEGNTA